MYSETRVVRIFVKTFVLLTMNDKKSRCETKADLAGCSDRHTER